MDNLTIARVFADVADLLEIKGENPFKIRAYRNGSDTIAHWPDPLATMDEAALRAIPGVGKDLAGKIRELVETGRSAYHQELLQEFPPTILELMTLQGVGPRTVARLHASLGIRTLADLEQAAKDGRIRALKGMGPKKEALILEALDERRRHAGRHLLSDTAETAAALVAWLQTECPATEFIPVGSLRRGCETCGDLDILAVGGTPAVIDRFVTYGLVERVLGQGDTKGSVLLGSGIQADLRLVPVESRGAAMQYFTGSKPHNISVRDRAAGRGLKLNEYGLFDVATGERVAGDSEAGIYERLGLAWVPPELREYRGELEAAESHRLPRLIAREDVLGDLHMHTTETDGRDDLEAMVESARAAGLRYLAITDHSRSLAMANGLDERRVIAQAARIRALNDRLEDFTVLAGIECDIRPDGSMDLADDCLAELDIVVASVHSAFNQDEAQMTDRVLSAIEHPYVDVIGHPTGRLLLKREPYRLQMDRAIAAAAAHGVALEINSQPDRLDLGDTHARLARERGVKLVVSSDAHTRAGLVALRWGVVVARRAWATPDDVLNTRPVEGFRAGLRRNRTRPRSEA